MPYDPYAAFGIGGAPHAPDTPHVPDAPKPSFSYDPWTTFGIGGASHAAQSPIVATWRPASAPKPQSLFGRFENYLGQHLTRENVGRFLGFDVNEPGTPQQAAAYYQQRTGRTPQTEIERQSAAHMFANRAPSFKNFLVAESYLIPGGAELGAGKLAARVAPRIAESALGRAATRVGAGSLAFGGLQGAAAKAGGAPTGEAVKQGAEAAGLGAVGGALGEAIAPAAKFVRDALRKGNEAAPEAIAGVEAPVTRNASASASPDDVVAEVKAAMHPDAPKFQLPSWNEMKQSAEANFFEELAPIKNAESSLLKMNPEAPAKLPVAQSPYQTARMALRGAASHAREFVNRGMRLSRDGTRIVKAAPGLDEILANVGHRADDLDAYLYARRALEVIESDRNPGITAAQAKAVVAKLDSPEFRTAADQIHKYQDALLQDLVDHGVLSDDAATAMRQASKDYVPLYRILDDKRFSGVGGGRFTPQNPVKRLKGSARAVKSPLESIIKNTYAYIAAAQRNDVITALDALSKDVPGADAWIKRVKPSYAPVNVTGAEVRKILAEQGIDAEMPKKTLDAVATLFRPLYRGNPAEHTLVGTIAGKRQVFKVGSEALYEALTAYNRQQATTLVRLLSYPASVLRAGATLSPNFALRNPIRDIWSAKIYSKYGVRVKDFAAAIGHILKKDDLYHEWLASGGGHAAMVSIDRDAMKELRSVLDKPRTLLQQGLWVPFHPVQALRTLTGVTEEIARIAEFGAGLRSGATPFEAGLASRDITLDFKRFGNWTKALNRQIPFFNAALQGTNKMVRFAREHPKDFIVRGATYITMPTMGLYFLNRNNPEYKALPAWKKATSWWLPTPWGLVPIPKPFELGYIFGTIPEAFLSYVDQHDPHALDGLSQQFTQTFVPNIGPTWLLPAVEWWTNYSFFKGRALVPEGDLYKLPADQYGPFTPETVKLMGRLFGLSPYKMENTISDVSGGLGRLAIGASDFALEKTGVVNPPVQPSSLRDIPGIGAFAPEKPIEEGSNVYLDDFYKERNHAQSVYNSARLHGRPSAKVHAHYSRMIHFARLISNVRDERDRVRQSTTLTADQKRTIIENLDVQMTKLARQALEGKAAADVPQVPGRK